MDQIELSYTILTIYSRFPGDIHDLKSASSVTVSHDCSSEELFKRIKEKEYFKGTSLLRIGLINNNQIIDFTINETIKDALRESPSSRIYLFRKKGENSYIDDNEHIPQNVSVLHRLSPQNHIHITNDEDNCLLPLNDALKSIQYPAHFKNSLFIHIYKVTHEKISQIIALQNDDDQLTLQTAHNAVKNALKQESIDKVSFLHHGYEIINEESFKRNKYSFITVINRPTQDEHHLPFVNLEPYEILIRISIYSILFSKRNLINLERFLNYCDQNKSFSFQTRELEIALLTIIQLLNQQIGNKWDHLNYYDLLIPESKNVNLSYYHTILLFGDTLVEYVRTTQLPLVINQNADDNIIQEKLNAFMPEFLECLDKTLSISLIINPEQTEIQTATVLYQKTLIYLLKILLSPILFLPKICICIKQSRKNFREKTEINKKHLIDLTIYFCSILLIFSIFNIIIYYSYQIQSIEANQMEIFWPLLLIISLLIILHVYQTSSFHRNRFLNKNLIENNYNKAHLNILEIKSTPNNTEPSKYLHKNHFYQILERKFDQLHPTLLHKSITQSLIIQTKSLDYFRSSILHCLIFILLIIAFIPLITIHPLIPTIYRIIHSNISLLATLWHIKLIHYSYIVLSFLFYTLLVLLMIKSISDYLGILSSTDLKKQVDFESRFYLNLRREENVEYFISLFREIIGNIDKNHILITTMTCTLLIDISLILTAIIRVFVYERSTDLLTVWCLIDIIILSFFLMLFIIVVVLINKSINYDFIRHLRNLKKDIITSNIVHKEEVINSDYLDVIIEHIESVTDQYSVKLLGFVVDHSLAIKIFISIITGIASAIASLVQQ